MRFFAAVLLFLFLLLIVPIISQAKTVIVPGDAATIQGGIDLAEEYDTVLVSPGYYIENFSILDRVVSVISLSGPEVTTLEPLDPDSPLLYIYKWTPGGPGDTVQCQFSGFTVTGTKNSGTIYIDLYSSPIISDNIFRDNILETNGDRAVIECYGDSGAPLITHNIFYGNSGSACVSVLAGAAQIVNNTFHANRTGVLSSSDRTVTINNIIVNSIGTGIDGAFLTLDYNDIWGNGLNYG